jgi:type I restriction enzyme S subunit
VHTAKKVRKGSLLICTASGSKSHLGKIAYIDDDYGYAFGGFMGQITPAPGVNDRYLFHALTSPAYKAFIEALNDGININNLKFDDLRQFPVPIPGIDEQSRIVTILDEAFEGIAAAKANAEKSLQNARNLFEIALNYAVQGRLVSQEAGNVSVSDFLSQSETARRVAITAGRAKARKLDSVETNNSNRSELPQGWRWVQLDSLTIGISDGVHKTPVYVAEGVPFVTVKNLTAGRGISFEALNYITKEDHQEYIKRTNPERGDILITKDGTIGVVRLIETGVEFSIFVSVALVKPAIRELGPYLAYALRATDVQSQIVPQGAALKHLYLVDLRRLQVPLPPPHMQSRIVERLDELDDQTQRLAGLYEAKIAALDELKKSLLLQAFAGALTTKSAEIQLEAVA